MDKLLTIVVPVYKVEPYINKCLDSCLLYNTNEQGEKVLDEDLMNQLEVIIVNDGTPDNSAEMSREYVKRYPQTFRQIDKENGGHGSAWNVGLKEATGKYLRFLDSDDWLTNLDKLMEKLQNADADIILTDYQIYYQKRNEFELHLSSLKKDAEVRLSSESLHALKNGYIEINFWHGTYKTSILKPLYPLFAEKVMYDDSVLSFAPIVLGRTMIAFDIVLYNYLLGREGQSMSRNVQIKNAHSYVVCLQHQERLKTTMNTQSISEDLLQCIDEVVYQYAHLTFGFMVYLPYNEAKTQMNRIIQQYPIRDNAMCSHLMKRYQVLPFWVFYLVENCRELYLRIKNKSYGLYKK
jgi:glycosyltransferase involved in cell wall biosynthesis